MKNVTLSMDEDLLKAGREYARSARISFNSLIRNLLRNTVMKSSEGWLEESFKLMDKAHGDSKGRRWKREDLYRG